MTRPTASIFAVALAIHLGGMVSATPVSLDGPTSSSIELLPIAADTRVLPAVSRPRKSVTLGASFDSQLLEVLVKEGQRVTQGQAIARLDDRVARASLSLAEHEANQTARLDRARLTLEQAQRVLERVRDANARGASNSEEVTAAQTEADIARADLAEAEELAAAARLRLQQARAQVERHLIRAPFDGIVMRLPLHEGSIVQSGDAIVELANVDTLDADLFLPAETATALALGDRYALKFHTPTNKVFWGQVRYIEPRIEPTSSTVRVTFELPAMEGLALAGTLVTPASRLPNESELAMLTDAQLHPALATQHREP